MIGDAINTWLKDVFKHCIELFVGIFSNLVDILDDEVLLLEVWSIVFMNFAGMFLVCIVLYRVGCTIFSAAYDSEVSATHIILDTIKASAAIPIMAVAQSILQTMVIFPLVKYFFGAQGMFAADAITEITSIGSIELAGFTVVLFLLFFAIVLGVFFVKMCIYYVEIVFFNLASAYAAISIATERSDYSKSWWQSLLKLNITLVAQVISLSVMIYGVTRLDRGILYLMLAIGAGVLVIRPPIVLQELWASSGTSRGLGRALSRVISTAVMRR